MNKSKWLIFQTSHLTNEIIEKLLEFHFDSKRRKGFELINQEQEIIHCNYIEENRVKETIADPFGHTSEVETVRYLLTQFRLHKKENSSVQLFLEVLSPPRSIRSLIDALVEALGKITISEIKLSVIDIYKIIKLDSPRAKIIKLKASGIALPNQSELKIEINSIGDAFNDYQEFFPNTKGKIDKIRIESPFLKARGFFEINSNGLCAFDESAETIVRSLILSVV